MFANDIVPMNFQPGFLTFYIICYLLYATVFVFTYAFYKNAKMKIYSKLNVRTTTYVLLGVILFLFIVIAIILTVLHYADVSHLFDNNIYMIPMSWGLMIASGLHLLIMCLIPIYVNRNKKQISNFRDENFISLLEILERNKPSDTYLINFKKRSARYVSDLEQYSKMINLSMENYKNDYEGTLLNIIVFNDKYTTK
jgi:uncharacterized membrane protein YidH (DUF202 family)